ncbi:poly(R)-hydroxyalkanoic acid synthase [Peptoniphilus equinus]|uniref:Poly(3-hydroxyalkanoate) polymerase subunit PhaE n=1 Tax=Peptoniphilus equinus TaxID=3016343 RepID=A0ABY7QSD5_9FIRM|nr:poly(R)-hydroxyalkanoic acid synthase subunit PhaE [Peptoniphilus equinus]WBW49700.1 poly(R)-hydroxyalkanoic acid synthase [Peptoniphilus equinus]
MEKDYNFFDAMMNQQQNYMNFIKQQSDAYVESATKFAKSFTTPDYKEITDKFFGAMTSGYTGTPLDVYENMEKAKGVVGQLYKLWQEVFEQGEPDYDRAKRYVEWFKTQQDHYYTQYIGPYLPAEFRELAEKSADVLKNYTGSLEALYGPWADAQKDLTDAYLTGMYEDPEGFVAFFNTWKDNYAKTFGKLFNMPTMGIDRISQQDRLQTFDRFIRFCVYSAEMNIKLSAIIQESTRNVVNEVIAMYQNGNQPEDFNAFYNFWKRTLSDDFERFFYTDEFTKFLGNYVESVLSLKIAVDKVSEEFLKNWPVATKTDMDSLYKTVYDLKKEVRRLRREMKVLQTGQKTTDVQEAEAQTQTPIEEKSEAKRGGAKPRKTAPKTTGKEVRGDDK